MASLDELKDAIKDTLENRGIIDQLRARIRAEIFNALEDKETPRPQLNDENLIINELIREYLEFNQYKHTASVFLPETGQPKDPLQRKFLAKEVNMVDDSTTLAVPLLYTILAKLREPTPTHGAPYAPGEYSLPPQHHQSHHQHQQQQHQHQHQREYEPEPPQNYSQRNHFNSNASTSFHNASAASQQLPPKKAMPPKARPVHHSFPGNVNMSGMNNSVNNNNNMYYDDRNDEDVQPLVFTHK